MIQIRSLAFHVLAYTSFVIVALVGSPFLFWRSGAMFVAKIWARNTIFLMRHIAGIRLEVKGLENVPAGGCLVAAKHQSALETFSMVPLLDDFAFILKRELNWVPLFGWYTWRTGMIPVNRGARSAALRDITVRAREKVAQGTRIIIYPEGTRRPPGAEPAYKFGVVHLYTQLGTPCVPVALDTGLFWPRHSFLLYPGTTTIEFLKPIPPGLDSDTFRTRLQETIETETNRLMAASRARGEGAPALQAAVPAGT